MFLYISYEDIQTSCDISWCKRWKIKHLTRSNVINSTSELTQYTPGYSDYGKLLLHSRTLEMFWQIIILLYWSYRLKTNDTQTREVRSEKNGLKHKKNSS